ncbi:MAG: PQQ-binding-like beta-propeller repeat protein [Schlesneria sp.]
MFSGNRLRRLRPICRFAVCFTIVLILANYLIAVAQSPKSRGEQKNEKYSKSLGVPDYAKIAGFVENANLPTEQPELLWQAMSETVDGQGKVVSYSLTDAAIADGVLYFGDSKGAIIAFDVNDQSELWTHVHGKRISTEPSVDNDNVYFGSEQGITALRRDNGTQVWHHVIEKGTGETTPIPVGEYVYTSGYDGRSYCLNRADGKVVWKHDFVEDAPPDPPEFASARARFQEIKARPRGAACDGRLFLQSVFDQSRVIAIECETGKRRWSFQTGGWMGPAPTIVDGRVYISSQDKHIYCLKLETGEVIWKQKTHSWLASQAAVYDGVVYLPHHGGKLYQFKADTGELIRKFEPPDEADRKGLVYSFPIISQKTAYFPSGSGVFFAVNIETGELRWKLRPSEDSELFTSPVTDGCRIFVTSRKGNEKTGEDSILAIGTHP